MTDQDLMQFLMNQLNKGYEQYKKDHPDFKEFVERELEGKTETELEEPDKEDNDWYKDHCLFCGEYLSYGVDQCPECGRLQIE